MWYRNALIQLYDNFLAKQITEAYFPGLLAELRELRLKLPRKGIKKTGPMRNIEPVTNKWNGTMFSNFNIAVESIHSNNLIEHFDMVVLTTGVFVRR